MPFFRINKSPGGLVLGTVEAEDATDALDVLAMKTGFWDFRDLAQSMDQSVEHARMGLTVRETARPTEGVLAPRPVPEFVVP